MGYYFDDDVYVPRRRSGRGKSLVLIILALIVLGFIGKAYVGAPEIESIKRAIGLGTTYGEPENVDATLSGDFSSVTPVANEALSSPSCPEGYEYTGNMANPCELPLNTAFTNNGAVGGGYVLKFVYSNGLPATGVDVTFWHPGYDSMMVGVTNDLGEINVYASGNPDDALSYVMYGNATSLAKPGAIITIHD